MDSSLIKTGESTAERLAEKKPLVLPLMRSHILQREREPSHGDSIKQPRGHSRTSTVSPVQLTPLNLKKGNCFKKLHRILQEANSKQASTRSASNHSIIEFHLNQEDEKLYQRNNLGLDGSELDRHDTNHSSTGIWLGNGSQNSGYEFKEDLAMQS